jgi:hypothetical protein
MKIFSKLAIASAVGLAFASGGAWAAATVSSQLVPGLQQISDDSGETLINMGTDAAGSPIALSYVHRIGDSSATAVCLVAMCDTTDTSVDLGDRLRGIMLITSASALAGQYAGSKDISSGGVSGVNQLAAIFDTTLTAITPQTFLVPDGMGGFVPVPNGFLTFDFAPTSLALSGFGAFGAPAGTAVTFFEKPLGAGPSTFDRSAGCTEFQGGTCEASITTGAAPYWYAGFDGDTSNNYWRAVDVLSSIGTNIAIFTTINNPGAGGDVGISLDQLVGGSGPKLGLVDCTTPVPLVQVPPVLPVDVQSNYCTTGELQGTKNVATNYPAWDEVNTTINVLPEPGSLALLGLGLGLGALALRRRQQA